MAHTRLSWWLDERRTGLTPVRHERAVSGFWSRHPRLVQVAAIAALMWGAIYLSWRAGWSGAGVSGWLFWPLLGAEAYGWLSLASFTWLAWRQPTWDVPTPLPFAHPVTVDVFVTTFDEPVEVVEPTLVGCMEIRGMHVTYLLDDGNRDEMQALAARYGVGYVTRSSNAHAKAGNINHALDVTAGELILVLDADHVPMPDILVRTLDYFDDPSVALVQTPHDFSNRDSVQHRDAARHEQSLFFEVIAPNKDRANAMFWCGSASMLRREALLDVGGVLTSTVAEDFHTTIAMHANGWVTRYHPEPLVQGLAPHDLASFLVQRARWARGNLGVFRTRQNPIWCPGLTLRQRLSYLGSLVHYFSGLQRLTFLSLLVTSLVAGQLPMHASALTLALLAGPWIAMAFTATRALGRGTLSTLDFTRFGLMTMGVQIRGVLSLAWPSAGRFKVTPKKGIDEGGLGVLAMLPVLTIGLAAVAGAALARLLAVAGIISLPLLSGLAFSVLLVCAAWESFCILMVLVPLARRRQVRDRYRLPVSGRARVDRRSTTFEVVDLSMSGLAFMAPVDIEAGTQLRLLTRLPDAAGRVHDVTLPVIVQTCRSVVVDRADGTGTQFRVGTKFDVLNDDNRSVLLEYCAVVHPALAHAVDGERPRQLIAAFAADTAS